MHSVCRNFSSHDNNLFRDVVKIQGKWMSQIYCISINFFCWILQKHLNQLVPWINLCFHSNIWFPLIVFIEGRQIFFRSQLRWVKKQMSNWLMTSCSLADRLTVTNCVGTGLSSESGPSCASNLHLLFNGSHETKLGTCDYTLKRNRAPVPHLIWGSILYCLTVLSGRTYSYLLSLLHAQEATLFIPGNTPNVGLLKKMDLIQFNL